MVEQPEMQRLSTHKEGAMPGPYVDNSEVDISIVLPVYNEAGNLEMFIPELSAALRAIGRSYEIIAVDDGSQDNSVAILGAQFLVMGLLGELQARTYFEVQNKPIYVIRREE
jgi:GT2 family glycosyltransferase